jgi:hypothetical protein
MATTTTNFGWDIPQSTDLVKDGATAIAALGQDIDTAFIDLKGGTTGQVLAKASGTDLDFSWVAQDDSNAIQNAIVDAKGDLIAATAADTPARLAVGTNGQVLTADSTAATGLKWASAASTGALTKISKVSFTSSSQVNQNSIFSSTYTNYFLVIELTNTVTNVDTLFRLRASGSDSSTSYSLQGYLSQGSTVVAESSSTAFPIIRAGSTTLSFGQLNLFNPFVAAHTGFVGANGGSHGYAANLNGRHTVATSYDGFSLIPGSGTITGSITIYGYEA